VNALTPSVVCGIPPGLSGWGCTGRWPTERSSDPPHGPLWHAPFRATCPDRAATVAPAPPDPSMTGLLTRPYGAFHGASRRASRQGLPIMGLPGFAGVRGHPAARPWVYAGVSRAVRMDAALTPHEPQALRGRFVCCPHTPLGPARCPTPPGHCPLAIFLTLNQRPPWRAGVCHTVCPVTAWSARHQPLGAMFTRWF